MEEDLSELSNVPKVVPLEGPDASAFFLNDQEHKILRYLFLFCFFSNSSSVKPNVLKSFSMFLCIVMLPFTVENTRLAMTNLRCWAASFYLSHDTTKPTKWHVRPAKTQISLGIRPV